MNSINLKILVYYLLFLYLSVTFVSASESNKNSEIENVISAQLKAFKAKDIYEAYSFASPQIKRRYPSPEIFDQMVKTSFNDIWNSKQYLFKNVKQMACGWGHACALVHSGVTCWGNNQYGQVTYFGVCLTLIHV